MRGQGIGGLAGLGRGGATHGGCSSRQRVGANQHRQALQDVLLPNRTRRVTLSCMSTCAVLLLRYARAQRFIESLPADKVQQFINWSEHGLCFCGCGDSAKYGDDDYYDRGEATACRACQDVFSGNPVNLKSCADICTTYAIPKGWSRFSLTSGSNTADAYGLWDSFHRKFHGTRIESLAGILPSGVLAKPGDRVIGSGGAESTLGEREGHFTGPPEERTNEHTGQSETFDINQV